MSGKEAWGALGVQVHPERIQWGGDRGFVQLSWVFHSDLEKKNHAFMDRSICTDSTLCRIKFRPFSFQ